MKIYKLSGDPGNEGGFVNQDRGREDPAARGTFSCPKCNIITDIPNPRGEIECSHCGHAWKPLQGLR